MATRTISTGDDVEAALLFLAKQKGVTSEEFFMDKVKDIMLSALKEADEKRYEMAKKLMDDKDKGTSISKLRELLGA